MQRWIILTGSHCDGYNSRFVNWDFFRKEWGATTFVLTVLVGMIVVPAALYFLNQGPSPISLPTPTASGAHVASSASGSR